MKELSIKEIMEAVSGTILRGSEDIHVNGISTDTRSLMPNEAFFALIGENFDAHDIVKDIDDNKCKAIVVSRDDVVSDLFPGAVILVSDTLRAYQDLAHYYKKKINPITIAVTGSVGKTSLKDMIASIASGRYSTVATDGNYNNHIGVPKTIFGLEEESELLILEMGMNHKDEIKRLVEIAEPTIAAISNVGLSHRENFDSEDGIYNAKMEVTSLFGEGDSLVINGDDERLMNVKNSDDIPYSVISVGENNSSDYIVSDIEYTGDSNLTFSVTKDDEKVDFSLPIAGRYNGVTAGMATAVSSLIGIDMQSAADSLLHLKRTSHRLQLIECGDIKIIDDVYNASPDSMKSALEYLMEVQGGRKIAVLAGMNELGEDSISLHREIGKIAVSLGVDIVIGVGEKARGIVEGAVRAQGNQNSNPVGVESLSKAEKLKIFSFRNNSDAADYINLHKKKNDVFLVKGSRAMKTEEIIDSLIGEKK